MCQHIVETLRDRQPRGFYWSDASIPGGRGDAWCAQCDAMLDAGGGDWTEELGARAGVTLICGACYDDAKALNGFAGSP